MANEGVNETDILEQILNETGLEDLIQALPIDIYIPIKTLILILKTIGIVFLIYLIFLLISTIMAIKKNIRIKHIYKKVDEIDKKLDKLVKEEETKEHKPEKHKEKTKKK